ncbi:hypothetical protein C5E45_10325 [Nocardia nova]|uniref:Uncharacterized protein n=2 Tax=Nocardia nova TaxID=37330 RepID=A0A2S6ASD0_9NOCA|nr:hypothetical protein C5E45_10325 [Nocardia nova]
MPVGAIPVGAVVRDVVAEVAPDELPVVDRLRQLGDERAARLLARRRSGGDLLGFGIDEVAVLASPVLWIVLTKAAEQFTEGAISGGGRAARRWLRKRLGRAKAVTVLPPLAAEQIAEVRAQVLDSALRSGMDADRARLLADSVAGRLVVDAVPELAEPSVEPDHDSSTPS